MWSLPLSTHYFLKLPSIREKKNLANIIFTKTVSCLFKCKKKNPFQGYGEKMLEPCMIMTRKQDPWVVRVFPAQDREAGLLQPASI